MFRRYENDGFALWAVVEKGSGELIGQCGITYQEYNGGWVPEVGYLFRKEFWHKGFATEAAIACKEYAFQVLDFDDVYSIIRDSNCLLYTSWHPKMLTVNYPFSEIEFGQREMFEKQFETVTGQQPTKDQMGFVHDRDVVVLYGDPAWDVKMQNPKPLGYKVDFKVKGKQCFVTITTNEYFDGGLMKGGKLKQEHVTDIPFAYYLSLIHI